MYELRIHKHAQKALKKAPARIKERAFVCLNHLRQNGTRDFPYALAVLVDYKKFKYVEAKIDKDYRIVFRFENEVIYIRYAGTHNSLGTG